MIYFTTYLVGLVIGFFAGSFFTKAVELEEEYISLTPKGQDYLDKLNNSDSTKQP